jgi:RNA polymerase sigma-70 factor (ECF subfamily)
MTDEELVNHVQNGDKEAFSRLIDRYQGKVFRTVVSLVGSHPDAEDLTQEVFLRAYKSIKSFRLQSSFSTWLYRISANMSKNFNIRRRVVSFITLDWKLGTILSVGDENKEVQETADSLLQCLQKIDEKYRQVLVLKEIEGIDYKEISKIMGLEIGTVKSRLSRAKEKLRIKWRDDHG